VLLTDIDGYDTVATVTDRTFRTLGVVGAGNMGSGIAQKLATEGFDVALVDLDDAKVARGVESIRRTVAEGITRGIFTKDAAASILGRIRPTTRFTDLADADLVVEAVFENLNVKQDVFGKLDRTCRADAILATNTSSFAVADVAATTQLPERVIGLHYFYHPAKNRLVEVVAGPRSGPDAVASAWALQEAIGKTPIRSKDSCGFIVNRFFSPWLNEAARLLEDGTANIATIEGAAKWGFGIGMGPFELMNVTGIPIAVHTADTLTGAFGALYEAPNLLKQQCESGQPWSLDGHVDVSRFDAVLDRLLAVTFYVAAALVDEGVGTREDTDIGARVGLRWRRGPFELMNHRGVQEAAVLATEVARRGNLRLPDTLLRQAASKAPFRLQLVTRTIAGGIATLTINRPDAMNALNERVLEQLGELFFLSADDPAIEGIIIAGTGKAFIAGADIRFFLDNLKSKNLDRIVSFTRAGQDLLLAIGRCAKTVVARVHGLTLGGGVELALACDYIVATPKASFAFPETGIGIYPGLGGTQRTTRRVGKGLAKWLVLTGQTIGADEALAIGLIDRVVAYEQLDAAARELIARGKPSRRACEVPPTHEGLAQFFGRESLSSMLEDPPSEDTRIASARRKLESKAPIALRIASELIDRGEALPLDQALGLELERVSEIFSTADAHEGLSSIGRRPPVFKGA
jgi:enoyl-CoA hydratase/3-hydroxyacyl-CoA dehydrogenase